jgi:nucleotide-binding universal stress UspA family protein
MSKAILVAVKPVLPQEFLVDFAVTVAGRHGLVVDACSVIDYGRLAPAEPVPIGGSAFKAERDQHAIAVARQNAAQVMSLVDATSRTNGVKCQTAVIEGDTVEVMASAVQRCDFLVCGHTRGGDASERSLLHSILKRSPRPALIVPQASSVADGAVLVAYDSSAQASRALASFVYSGLPAGRVVHIVTFDIGAGQTDDNTHNAEEFLSRHGIPSQTHIMPLSKDLTSQIIDEARHFSASLIVMGAFGRSSVREFFLGSITRSMLDLLPLPVFLDH